jgi:hypothetical protein
VAALVSDSLPFPSTGGLYELAVGWHARTRLQAGRAMRVPSSTDISITEASEFWRGLSSYDQPGYPEDAAQGLLEVQRSIRFDALQRIRNAKRRKAQGTVFEYTDNEVMLYSGTLSLVRSRPS